MAVAAHRLSGQQPIRLERLAVATSARLYDLGSVTDASGDAAGRVFILDRTGPRVVFADARLRRSGYFGRGGSGPGEFREPVSLVVLPSGRVAVLDRALRRVTILALEDSGRVLRTLQTVAIQSPAEAMCALNDRQLLIFGLSGGQRLWVLGLDGRDVRSFAPVDAKLSPIAREVMAQGRITCDRTHDEVVVSNRFLPIIETYRISTGERISVDTLRPFRPIVVTDRGNKVSLSAGRAGFSVVSSVFTIGDFRVFQTTYESRLDTVMVDTVVTHVYARRAHAWLPSTFDLPLLFRLNSSTALSVEGEEWLQIGVNRVLLGTGARVTRP